MALYIMRTTTLLVIAFIIMKNTADCNDFQKNEECGVTW